MLSPFTLFSQVSNDKLVAHYELNGNANDASMNQLNGTPYNISIAPDRFNNPNGATSFDGVSSYILVPNNNKFHITDSLTVAVWVNQLAKPNKGWNPVFSKRYAFVDDPYASFELSNHVDLDYKWIFNISAGTPGSLLTPTSKQTSTFGVWKFIVGVFDGNSVKLYVNGNLDTTIIKNTPIGYSDLSFYIGYNGTGLNEYFKGSLDDLRIYARALNSNEIISLYNYSPVGTPSIAGSKSNIIVYPNPVNNNLNFSEAISSLSIFDIYGKLIIQINDPMTQSVDLSNLPKGIFQLRANTGKQEFTTKIVKE